MIYFPAQAAGAPPFPLGRKRRQKGPFCTASGGTGMLLNPFDMFGEAHKTRPLTRPQTFWAFAFSLCEKVPSRARRKFAEPASAGLLNGFYH